MNQQDNKNQEKDFELQRLQSDLQKTRRELHKLERLYASIVQERDSLAEQRNLLQAQYDCIANSTSWRMTKPVRSMLDFFKGGMFRRGPLKLLRKFVHYLKVGGVRAALHKTKQYLSDRRRQRMLGRLDLSQIPESRRSAESAVKFDKDICFSILVPLYNTPIDFLNEMIQSVVGQTYPKWELCLADGSDAEHSEVEKNVSRWAQKDSRIKYRKLEKNLGISENTNACIELSTGEYIALFDHDDVLHPSALFEMMKAICEQNADFIYTDEALFDSPDIKKIRNFHYKPDFSPDYLRSSNYICHFSAFSRELMDQVGRFRSEFDGSQDYDMILRLTEQAKQIVHIPEVLYFWRSHAKSVALDISAKPYTLSAARRAIRAHLERVGLKAKVQNSSVVSTYRLTYEIEGSPMVSIIIPNMDHIDVLEHCIESVENLTTYPNYEILIVENNSRKAETFAYYEAVAAKYSNIRVIKWEHEFNYSKINNFAAAQAKGEYLVLLNNDIEIITPGWIEEMLMYVQREDVGAAGMMLYYPDDTVQHAGVIIGLGGVAGHSHKYFPRHIPGYMARLSIVQNLSAVTAASLMIKASVFAEIGGLDPEFAVAFNDVDLCMKVREAGYLIVFTPYAEAYHYESKSRGMEDTPEKVKRFNGEIKRFRSKWGALLEKGDPYYSPHLTLDYEDFRLK